MSLILFIKHEQDDVEKLVKKIAANAATGAKLVEEFARRDPSIRLDDFRLPPGEAATREAIAASKKKELLGQTGDAFELSLLLSCAACGRQLRRRMIGNEITELPAERELCPRWLALALIFHTPPSGRIQTRKPMLFCRSTTHSVELV